MRWTGEDLRRARVEAGITQRDFSGGSGIPRWRSSQLEREGTELTSEEERRAKITISYLGDLERKKRQFISSNRHDAKVQRYQRHRKTVEDLTEDEAEPALP